MRAFSPLINIFLTCVSAVAMTPVLTMPWFSRAVDSNDGTQGSVELMGEAIGRWFTDTGTTATGAAALGSMETAIVVVAGVSALLALGMLAPPLRAGIRGIVKILPLATPLVVLVAIVAEAGPQGVEPRYGAFVALALSVFLATAAQQAGEMREKKKPAPRPYSSGAPAR